jgi:hypothetical protein
VAYDIEGLFPEQYNDFGNFAVAMILAHEWGHAIQERAYGLERAQAAGIPSIVLETQADCFAGTWARRVNDKKSKTLIPEPGDLDAALSGLLSVADQVGQEASAEGAHGSAFDRISVSSPASTEARNGAPSSSTIRPTTTRSRSPTSRTSRAAATSPSTRSSRSSPRTSTSTGPRRSPATSRCRR